MALKTTASDGMKSSRPKRTKKSDIYVAPKKARLSPAASQPEKHSAGIGLGTGSSAANLRFDHVLHITGPEVAGVMRSLAGKHDGNVERVCQDIVDLLKQSLGKRVNEIQLIEPDVKQENCGNGLVLGITLSPDNYMDMMERGPEGSSAESRQFRQLWGDDVCQLRRFPDGSVGEAVFWQCSSRSDKRMVCARIATHVLQRHAAFPKRTIHYIGNLWTETLSLHRVELPVSWPAYASGEEYLARAVQRYDALCLDLRNISDLPLAISSIRSTSASLRHTEPFPPLPATLPPASPRYPFTPSISVQVVLEGSSRWPDDLQAIRRLKTAFLLHICERLRQKEEYHVLVTEPERLQIWSAGLCFQVEVVYLGEVQLARKVRLPDGRFKMEDTPLFQELRMKLDYLPRVTAALAGVARQFESFGMACRLTKRWLSCHLYSGYLAEEVTECIMAHVFLKPAHHRPPVAPDLAFLRFLHILSVHPWHDKPLIVDFAGELKREQVVELEREFVEKRDEFPAMSVLVPFERTSLLTGKYPTPVLLRRLVATAKSALETAQAMRMVPGKLHLDAKTVFRASLNRKEWDVIIHLRGKQVTRSHQRLDLLQEDPADPSKKLKLSNLPILRHQPESKSSTHFQTDLDTVSLYLDRLRAAYDHCAYFMADPCGEVVVVKWKKEAFRPVTLERVGETGLAGHALPAGAGKGLVVNAAAVVEDLTVLGRGLVAKVHLCSDNWNI